MAAYAGRPYSAIDSASMVPTSPAMTSFSLEMSKKREAHFFLRGSP